MRNTSVAPRRLPRFSARGEETIAGYLFSLPALVILFAFLVIPVLGSLALAFTDYDLMSPPVWSGAENFRRLIGDVRMWTCYRNSLVITIGAVIGNNVIGLLLALGINLKMPMLLKDFLRSSFFFPVMATTSSLAIVWHFILATDRGVMNWVIGTIGLGPVGWLSSPDWAILSVIIYDVWKSCGYLMVLYLAGLQGVPEVLYEAAKMDGANRWQRTVYVTLPMITPTAFFCLVISSIGAFKIFDNAYVLTGGGPGDASRTIAMYIYEVAFKRYDMGYSAMVGLSLLLILVVLTILQFRVARRWVHYE